ncbi:hypothetical protein ACROYT_G014240 [Oculina patagonica]
MASYVVDNTHDEEEQEFINTLDEEMAKKLAIIALQKGVGNMDFVDSLLIMEPEDDDSTDQEHDVAGDGSPVRVPQASQKGRWSKLSVQSVKEAVQANGNKLNQHFAADGRRTSNKLEFQDSDVFALLQEMGAYLEGNLGQLDMANPPADYLVRCSTIECTQTVLLGTESSSKLKLISSALVGQFQFFSELRALPPKSVPVFLPVQPNSSFGNSA